MWKKKLPLLLAIFCGLTITGLLLTPIAAGAPSSTVSTQLAIVIDGSGTFTDADWSVIVSALYLAVNNSMPHDGSVELTIVQLGYENGVGARTEVAPTVLTATTQGQVADQIMSIKKIGGSTSMADGLFLAWKDIKSSPNFQSASKQAINLATDGIPNVRNMNATRDFDGNGEINAYDDAVAVVNGSVSQGLDELDMELIGLSDANSWFRDNIVYPQPGGFAPPFNQTGWVRQAIGIEDFANSLPEDLQVMIEKKQEIYVPQQENALMAVAATVGTTAVVATIAEAVAEPESFRFLEAAEKISEWVPDGLKKWLSKFNAHKHKMHETKVSKNPFKIANYEMLTYAAVMVVVATLFAFAKAETFDELLIIIPTLLLVSIIIEFAQHYLISVLAKFRGVQTENRLWYFGLALFVVSSIFFRVPFSSASKLVHGESTDKKTRGIIAACEVLIPFALASLFWVAFINRFALFGSMGLVMCFTAALMESVPIPRMNGKEIYSWKKGVWAILFVSSIVLYTLLILML